MRFGTRTIAAIVLVVVTMVLIGVVTTLSWWTISNGSVTEAWYLGSACSGSTCEGYQGHPALHDTFSFTSLLVLSSLALSILTLILLVLSLFWPRLGIGTFIAGFLGSVLLIAAPLYLFSALPGAVAASSNDSFVTAFFGSYTVPGYFGTTTYTWGGGSGWYMAFVAFAVFLVSSYVAYAASRSLMALGDVTFPARRIPAEGAAVPSGISPPAGAQERFCPNCGARYPAGTQFCSRDATSLKDAIA